MDITITRAKTYFLLADQYFEVAKQLLKILIKNGNSNAGIGNTEKEARSRMERNVSQSDAMLFIPAIFNSLQCSELFLKGMLLLKRGQFKIGHDVQEHLQELQNAYSQKPSVPKVFVDFYNRQVEIISKYKLQNKIKNTNELYISLRYPEYKRTHYNYHALMYNGAEGITQFREILKELKAIKKTVLKEYNLAQIK